MFGMILFLGEKCGRERVEEGGNEREFVTSMVHTLLSLKSLHKVTALERLSLTSPELSTPLSCSDVLPNARHIIFYIYLPSSLLSVSHTRI